MIQHANVFNWPQRKKNQKKKKGKRGGGFIWSAGLRNRSFLQSLAFLQHVLLFQVYFCPKNGFYLLAEKNFYRENHVKDTRLSSPA